MFIFQKKTAKTAFWITKPQPADFFKTTVEGAKSETNVRNLIENTKIF